MTEAPTNDSAQSIETADGGPVCMNRRQFIGTTAAATVALATGAGSGAASTSDPDVDFSSEFAEDPYINGLVTVDENKPDFSQMEYTADDESVASLTDDGIVMARPPEDSPHNPVSYAAADVEASEYHAFPRGVTYDDDADTSTDEVPVEWHDPTHWTTTGATNGSITLAEVEGDGMRVYSSALADTETVKATFDLSTVGSSDGTITSGMSRKFLQLARDIDALPSVVTIDYALIDSAGTEVAASDVPGGDTSLVDVLAASTGASQVSQVRVGELESAQSVALDDIQKFQIRISASGGAGDGDITLHGANAEKAEKWEYGTQEFTDADGNVDTQTVYEPSGTFSITRLDTLPNYFQSGTIKNLQLDVELKGSKVPDEQTWVREKDAPSAYDQEDEVEDVYEFEWPTAYAIDVTSQEIENIQALPSGDYLEVSYATAIADIDEWADIEDSITWTDKSGSLSGVGSTVTLKSSTASSDRMGVRFRRVTSSSRTDALLGRSTSSGSEGAVAVGGGGGGGLWTILGGLAVAVGVWKRKLLKGIFG